MSFNFYLTDFKAIQISYYLIFRMLCNVIQVILRLCIMHINLYILTYWFCLFTNMA